MKTFNPKQYLAIDIANNYGMDKENWDTRIQWVKDNYDQLESYMDTAADKFLYIKAVKTLRKVDKGEDTGFVMALDATASGYQIMACLSGCKKTALAVNLVDTGKRVDLYNDVAVHMNETYGTNVTRAGLKKPIMTLSYGSKRQPESIFGVGTPELKAFYETLETRLTGAIDTMGLLRECWNSEANQHSFKMPDGHVVVLPTMVDVAYEIDVGLDSSILFTLTENEPSKDGTNIIANTIHAVDAYIAREMVRKANAQGFQLAHIHDSFWASPVYMNNVRKNYVDILADIAESNLLADIMSQLTSEKVEINKDSTNLAKLIRKSEYALS